MIEKAKHILVVFPAQKGGDAIGAASAMALLLKQMGKRVDIVSHGFIVPKSFAFLETAQTIRPELGYLKKTILSVDVKQTGIREVSYDVKDDMLRIFLLPKEGQIKKESVVIAESDFSYDCIVTIGAEDLHQLGSVFAHHTDFFYGTPIINLDTSPGNEHFGQINIVDTTASCVSELLTDQILGLGEQYMVKEIATALLAGIIAETRSFKTAQMKPRTLTTASTLIRYGANREDIVERLYRTRTIASLKLWGTALTHLKNDPSIGLVWTTITRDDFVRSHANESDLYDIVEELIGNAPEAKMILLLHEHPTDGAEAPVHAVLSVHALNMNALELLAPFRPTGDKRRAHILTKNKTLGEMETEVTGEIRKRCAPLQI